MGIRRRGKSWVIDYYAGTRRIRETVHGSKRQAEEQLIRRKAEILAGTHAGPRAKELNLSEAAAIYLEWAREHKRTWQGDAMMLGRVDSLLGEPRLQEITPWVIEQLKRRLREMELSGPRVNRYLACLSGLFRRLGEWDLYQGENPLKRVRRYRESPGRLRYLSGEEIARLLAACEPELKPVVVVALGTGMRQGEIFGLRWQEVDLAGRLIHVTDSKNGERRDIPMGEGVYRALASQPRHGKLVFCRPDGTRHPTRLRCPWQRACGRAELEGLRFHDLRHTFASQLVMGGASLFAVQELLGHKTLVMTRRYSHLAPGVRQQAVATMDSFLGRSDALRRSQDGHMAPEKRPAQMRKQQN